MLENFSLACHPMHHLINMTSLTFMLIYVAGIIFVVEGHKHTCTHINTKNKQALQKKLSVIKI